MEVHRTESPGSLSNAYLIDDGAGTGVLIDGNGFAAPLLEAVARCGLRVPAVLLTHHHVDHVMLTAIASSALRSTLTSSQRVRSLTLSTPF